MHCISVQLTLQPTRQTLREVPDLTRLGRRNMRAGLRFWGHKLCCRIGTAHGTCMITWIFLRGAIARMVVDFVGWISDTNTLTTSAIA